MLLCSEPWHPLNPAGFLADLVMKLSVLLSLSCLVPAAYGFVPNAPVQIRIPTDSFRALCPLPTVSIWSSTDATPRCRRSRSVLVCGADIAWSKTSIVETSEVAVGQHYLKIQAGDIASEYNVPGQYVQIKVKDADKPGFFAISSPPTSDGILEFLIKATESTEPIVNAKAGAQVQMSPVMGKGFPIEENFRGYKYDFPVQNVVLTATGTGIAPLRATIESGVLELTEEEDTKVFGRSCKLYWGCRNEETMPWADKIKEWDARGVEVIPVLSQPSGSWTGRKGYVQAALKEDGVRVPRNTAVLMCGHKGMADEVKEITSKAGVLEGRVLTNF